MFLEVSHLECKEQLVSFECWCRGFVGIPFADICLAVRFQKIRPIYTSWHSMRSSIDYPTIFMRWSKFHQGLFVPVEGLVQSPLVTLRIQESFLFAAFLYLGANVLLVVQWPKWRCFVMLTVLLQEIRALVKCILFSDQEVWEQFEKINYVQLAPVP